MTRAEIAKSLGITPDGAKFIIDSLKAQGRIKREGVRPKRKVDYPQIGSVPAAKTTKAFEQGRKVAPIWHLLRLDTHFASRFFEAF